MRALRSQTSHVAAGKAAVSTLIPVPGDRVVCLGLVPGLDLGFRRYLVSIVRAARAPPRCRGQSLDGLSPSLRQHEPDEADRGHYGRDVEVQPESEVALGGVDPDQLFVDAERGVAGHVKREAA